MFLEQDAAYFSVLKEKLKEIGTNSILEYNLKSYSNTINVRKSLDLSEQNFSLSLISMMWKSRIWNSDVQSHVRNKILGVCIVLISE